MDDLTREPAPFADRKPLADGQEGASDRDEPSATNVVQPDNWKERLEQARRKREQILAERGVETGKPTGDGSKRPAPWEAADTAAAQNARPQDSLPQDSLPQDALPSVRSQEGLMKRRPDRPVGGHAVDPQAIPPASAGRHSESRPATGEVPRSAGVAKEPADQSEAAQALSRLVTADNGARIARLKIVRSLAAEAPQGLDKIVAKRSQADADSPAAPAQHRTGPVADGPRRGAPAPQGSTAAARSTPAPGRGTVGAARADTPIPVTVAHTSTPSVDRIFPAPVSDLSGSSDAKTRSAKQTAPSAKTKPADPAAAVVTGPAPAVVSETRHEPGSSAGAARSTAIALRTADPVPALVEKRRISAGLVIGGFAFGLAVGIGVTAVLPLLQPGPASEAGAELAGAATPTPTLALADAASGAASGAVGTSAPAAPLPEVAATRPDPAVPVTSETPPAVMPPLVLADAPVVGGAASSAAIVSDTLPQLAAGPFAPQARPDLPGAIAAPRADDLARAPEPLASLPEVAHLAPVMAVFPAEVAERAGVLRDDVADPAIRAAPPGEGAAGQSRAAIAAPADTDLPIEVIPQPTEPSPSPAAMMSSALPEPRPAATEADELAPAAAAPTAIVAPDVSADYGALSVFVHAPTQMENGDLGDVVSALNGAGFALASTPSRVGFTVSENHVRFYRAEDAEAAGVLAATIGGRARDFTNYSPRPAAGHIEVWLEGKAAPGTAAPTRRTSTRQGPTEAERIRALRDRLILQLRRGDLLGR